MKTIEQIAQEAGFRLIPQAAPGVNRIYTGSASGRCEEALARFAALVAERCMECVVPPPDGNHVHPVDHVMAVRRAILAEFPKP